MKVSTNFDLREFVPPELWMQYGERCVWFVDPRLFLIAEALRDVCRCPIRVNDWHTGGRIKYRGYRPPHLRQSGWALYSQHYRGAAFDSSARGLTPAEMLARVQNNLSVFLPMGLTTAENPAYTPTWLHLDVRPWAAGKGDQLLIVNP